LYEEFLPGKLRGTGVISQCPPEAAQEEWRGRLIERDHRGWTIEVTSYETDKGTWRPSVVVSIDRTSAEVTRTLVTPPDWVFDTEQQSDEHGYQLAVTWIDEG